jgi:hypothetical protein
VTQKLVVSVDGVSGDPDRMTVQEAFSHVLDLFQLVAQSDPGAEGVVQWRLLSVTMNSPLTVVAEAIPAYPGAVIEEAAKRQKASFSRNYRELTSGRMPAMWSTTKGARETATRVLTRNRTGIGKTVVNAAVEPDEAPITLTKEDADRAVVEVAINAPQPQRTKEQVGSIEGRLLLIHHYRGQPAIQIEERRTKETVWAIVPEEFQHQISESTSVEDVWKGRRVVVRGRIIYGTDGLIARVVATNIRLVETKQVDEHELVDKAYTGGLPVADYLDRLREGNLGS